MFLWGETVRRGACQRSNRKQATGVKSESYASCVYPRAKYCLKLWNHKIIMFHAD